MVPLPASTAITVSVNGLEDVAGNRIATHVSQFTTGAGADTVRPTVIATNVTAYGVNNVPTNAAVPDHVRRADGRGDRAVADAGRSSTTTASALI